MYCSQSSLVERTITMKACDNHVFTTIDNSRLHRHQYSYPVHIILVIHIFGLNPFFSSLRNFIVEIGSVVLQ